MKTFRHLLALLLVSTPVLIGMGGQTANAVSCWSSVGTPTRSGSSVVTTVTWSCSNYVQSIQSYGTLDAPNGTHYSGSNTCSSTSYCSVTISGAFVEGTWTARAQYAYVVETTTGQYFYNGGSASAYVSPPPPPTCSSYAANPYRSGNYVYAQVQINCSATMDVINITPYLGGPNGMATSFNDTCYGTSSCVRYINFYYIPGNWVARVSGSATAGGVTVNSAQSSSSTVYIP